jgi:cullin-associated NEDD8-dissociated protein 1
MFDQALETLLLRSLTEAAPFLNSIVQIGNQFIKYDPVSYEFKFVYD